MTVIYIGIIILLGLVSLAYRTSFKAICTYIRDNGPMPDEAAIKKYVYKALTHSFSKPQKEQQTDRIARLLEEIDRVIDEAMAKPGMTPQCHERIRSRLLCHIEKKFENRECRETLQPYMGMLLAKKGTFVVRGDCLEYNGETLSNKKLLPYDGRHVEVAGYEDRIIVFTEKGDLIVALYKYCFQCK